MRGVISGRKGAKVAYFDKRKDMKKQIYQSAGRLAKTLLRYVLLTGLSFIMLYPVFFMLSLAFKAIVDVYDPTVIWIPKNFSLQPLNYALQILSYQRSLVNTLWVLIPSVLLQIFSTLITAYGFARFNFRGRNLLFALLMFTIIVPIQTYSIPLFMNFREFTWFGLGSIAGLFPVTGAPLTSNLLDSNNLFYIMAATGMGIRSGLYIFIMRQFFINLPKELEDASLIDGCGPIRTFTHVMIPNVIPAIVTVTVFSIVWYWNDYYYSIMFFSRSINQTLSVSLTMAFQQITMVNNNQGAAALTSTDLWLLQDPIMACASLLVILPLLAMYLFAQKFFTESIERTGIVG
jgi:multiple sugar transport system permease protein